MHASDEMVKNSRLFGEMIGIAFQIKDDIFDYYSSDEIGKPTGNDMREGKLTLPALYVLNMFDDEEMRKLALRIRALDASDEDIARFIEYTKVKGGIEYARPVSYTHLDVYKRQGRAPKTSRNILPICVISPGPETKPTM